MEVHKHPHHVTHSKKWFEYLLEFIMLFLAVYLGFVAENIREHKLESEREIQYVQTLYADLKSDTISLNRGIMFWELHIKRIDSLRNELRKDNSLDLKLIAKLSSHIRQYDNFLYHDRTITQLKNSGNYRLFKSKGIADSLMEYDSYINSQLRDMEAGGREVYITTNNLYNRIFDSQVDKTLTDNGEAYFDSLYEKNPKYFRINLSNKNEVFEFYNELDYWIIFIKVRLYASRYLKNKAKNLLRLINDEYKLAG